MTADTKPMDRSELKSCRMCGKGVLHTGDIHFYEVSVSQCVADLESIQQQHGLELMMGGAAALATVFAPNTRVAHRLPATRVLICSQCALNPAPVALLLEDE